MSFLSKMCYFSRKTKEGGGGGGGGGGGVLDLQIYEYLMYFIHILII